MVGNWRKVAFAAIVMGAAVAGVQSGARAEAADDAVARRAPKTVEIKMTNEGGASRFEPSTATIAVGDTVKWIMAGGSHNIEFWPDSMPAGALPALRAAMHDTVAPLRSNRFPNPGDSYTMVFAGVEKGTYKYFCQPHLRRGMTASIIVE